MPPSPRRVPRRRAVPLLRRRAAAFRFAGRGLWVLLVTQANARLHLAAALLVVAAGAWLGVPAAGWRWLAAAICAVWAAEAFNTAFELLCDAAHPGYSPKVRDAKDVSAGAVLAVALGAAAVGVVTLGPPLWAKLAG